MASERETRGSFIAIAWGSIVLFLGVVLLLQATGVLDWALWGTLWKFWPVLIIIIGLAFLVPRRYGWLMAAGSIVILGICLWVSVVLYGPSSSHVTKVIEQRFTYPAIGVDRADATVNFAAGNVTIGELQGNNQLLVEILDQHGGKPQGHLDTMQATFNRQGGTVNIDVEPISRSFWNQFPITWSLSFNPRIPVDLDIKCDASQATLALQNLDVQNLQMTMNASGGSLTLPASAGDTVVNLDMNVSNLDIVVPEGVAAKLTIDNSLSIVTIDQNRFVRQGNIYISPGYERTKNGVELNIRCNVSRLVIK